MRPVKISVVVLLAVLVVMLALAGAAGASPCGAQTYKVLVGAENASQGIDVMAYFPSCVRIHVGDTRALGPEQQRDPHGDVPGRHRRAGLRGHGAEPGAAVDAQPARVQPGSRQPGDARGRPGQHHHVRELGPHGPRGGRTRLLRPALHGGGHLPLPLPRARRHDVGHRARGAGGHLGAVAAHGVRQGPRQIAAKMAQLPAVVRAAWREYQPPHPEPGRHAHPLRRPGLRPGPDRPDALHPAHRVASSPATPWCGRCAPAATRPTRSRS